MLRAVHSLANRTNPAQEAYRKSIVKRKTPTPHFGMGKASSGSRNVVDVPLMQGIDIKNSGKRTAKIRSFR